MGGTQVSSWPVRRGEDSLVALKGQFWGNQDDTLTDMLRLRSRFLI